jgi:hypothetical protein
MELGRSNSPIFVGRESCATLFFHLISFSEMHDQERREMRREAIKALEIAIYI